MVKVRAGSIVVVVKWPLWAMEFGPRITKRTVSSATRRTVVLGASEVESESVVPRELWSRWSRAELPRRPFSGTRFVPLTDHVEAQCDHVLAMDAAVATFLDMKLSFFAGVPKKLQRDLAMAIMAASLGRRRKTWEDDDGDSVPDRGISVQVHPRPAVLWG